MSITSSTDINAAIAAMPYACFLGVTCQEQEGHPLFCLPYRPENIGNILLPAIHGGVLGAFMEIAALFALQKASALAEKPKVIDFSIDFLRSAGPQDVFALCDIVRQGKRVANVLVSAWQADPQKPVATARAHFLLGE